MHIAYPACGGNLAGGHVEHCYPLISGQREPTATGITSSRDEWRMDRKHFSIGVQVPLANHCGWVNCWFLLPTYLPTYLVVTLGPSPTY
jgi:hypothetical protein